MGLNLPKWQVPIHCALCPFLCTPNLSFSSAFFLFGHSLSIPPLPQNWGSLGDDPWHPAPRFQRNPLLLTSSRTLPDEHLFDSIFPGPFWPYEKKRYADEIANLFLSMRGDPQPTPKPKAQDQRFLFKVSLF